MTTDDELLEGLNDAQRQAVTHVDGPALVLAGPGSGKTRVVARRVARLVNVAGIDADRIVAVTFTNKAADEMRRRVGEMVLGPPPLVATFHRLCARLLRQYGTLVGVGADYTILDQDDRLQQLGRMIKDLGLDTASFTPRRIDQRISRLKNDLVTAEEFAARPHDFFDGVVADVYPKYQERLRGQNAVDFDDLLTLVVELLEKHPEVRARLDRKFQYMMVDEYQDTNKAQYRIARLLNQDVRNLVVTGDPDQSIYSWRGASPENVFQFEKDYPDHATFRLEENYRSTALILRAADGLIRRNTRRKHKELVTANPAGAAPLVLCHASDEAEAQYVAETIRAAVNEGRRRYRDFAVFFRTSALWGRFETAFRGRQVPYQVVGGQSFFQRREIKDVLAYARLSVNPRDDAAFERVVNLPARGLGETTLARLRHAALARGMGLLEAAGNDGLLNAAGVKGKQRGALQQFQRLVLNFALNALGPPHPALTAILDDSGYRETLEALDDDERTERAEALDGMLRDAEAFATSDPQGTLRDFLEMIGLLGGGDEGAGDEDKATIMTLHAAKGLEFPAVFLVAFEQDILPHERAVQEGGEEEERRLAFVGITRAREELTISYALRRYVHGRPLVPAPSPFLGELPPEALQRDDQVKLRAAVSQREYEEWSQEPDWEEPAIQIVRKAAGPSPTDRFAVGMFVEHPKYGTGRIAQLDGVGNDRKATVLFPSVGSKRFVLALAPLTPA